MMLGAPKNHVQYLIAVRCCYAKSYNYFTLQDRPLLMRLRDDQCNVHAIAKRLCSSASAICCELKHHHFFVLNTLNSH